MVPVPFIVQRLLLDAGVAPLVSTYVADHRITRKTDPNYFDSEGNVKVCLGVDDAGELPQFGAPRVAAQDVFYVWAFAPDTAAGRISLRSLIPATITALDGWRVPETKQLITYTRQRLGNQQAVLTDACMDRLIFTCSGTHPGIMQ